MSQSPSIFGPRGDDSAVEGGLQLSPKFDDSGLIPCITTDADSGEVLMLAWMNAEALQRTLETGQAHYWSRSRGSLWLKGESSGQIQTVRELRIDCDQDAVLLSVDVGGDGGCCHVGGGVRHELPSTARRRDGLHAAVGAPRSLGRRACGRLPHPAVERGGAGPG